MYHSPILHPKIALEAAIATKVKCVVGHYNSNKSSCEFLFACSELTVLTGYNLELKQGRMRSVLKVAINLEEVR